MTARRHQRLQRGSKPGVWREHAVDADHVLPGLRDRGGEAPEEFDRLEDDVSLAGVPWFAQLEAELAVLGPRQYCAGRPKTAFIRPVGPNWTGPDAQAWLAAHPRVTFVFTPYHGSWLNQVEIWFSILTSKCLKGRAFNSGRALSAAVRAFARHWNSDFGHPFNWNYSGKVLHA